MAATELNYISQLTVKGKVFSGKIISYVVRGDSTVAFLYCVYQAYYNESAN